MAKPPMRPGVLTRLFTNFWQSVRYGRHQDQEAVIVGEDFNGNKYYEIPPNPRLGRRRARRWYTSDTSGHHDVRNMNEIAGFDAELPSEWESWLRHRRDDPPTIQQLIQSQALADIKKRNAAELERKRQAELIAEGRYVGPSLPLDHEKNFFPKYDEYKVMPGEEENKDRWKDFKNPYLNPDEDMVTKKSKDSK